MAQGKEGEPQPPPLTFATVIAIATEATRRTWGHQPTVIVDDGRVRLFSIVEWGETHEERVENMALTGYEMGKSAELGALKQVFFISEGWMSRHQRGTPPVPPTEDPDCIEVLLVSRLDVAQKRNELAVYEIVRQGEAVVDLSHQGDLSSYDSPLLKAFAVGFQMGRGAGGNGSQGLL